MPELLSAAGDLPLPVFGEPDYPEDIRLRYRFLDLRRETIHKKYRSSLADHLLAQTAHDRARFH